jgi:hypothetical protein
MAVRKKKPATRLNKSRTVAKTAQAFKLLKKLDPTSVAREGEVTPAMISRASRALGKINPSSVVRDSKKKKLPPRAPGSERSFAFTSVNSEGKKTTRFSDKPTPRKGEKRKRFR